MGGHRALSFLIGEVLESEGRMMMNGVRERVEELRQWIRDADGRLTDEVVERKRKDGSGEVLEMIVRVKLDGEFIVEFPFLVSFDRRYAGELPGVYEWGEVIDSISQGVALYRKRQETRRRCSEELQHFNDDVLG
jgi:hypothetical protein